MTEPEVTSLRHLPAVATVLAASETAPLLDYYAGELKTVDAVGSLDEVFARALHALGR